MRRRTPRGHGGSDHKIAPAPSPEKRTGLAVTGQCNEHQVRGARVGPQATRDLEAVEIGQADVEQHDGGLLAGCEVEHGAAFIGRDHVVPVHLEQEREAVGRIAVVVDDEDAGGVLLAQPRGEPEGAAGARGGVAYHSDLAVHQPGELLADGEAEPGAAVAAGGGGVGLREGGEELCLLLGG